MVPIHIPSRDTLVKSYCARFSISVRASRRSPEFRIQYRHAGAPGRRHGMSLDEDLDGGLDFPEATLLAPNEHLLPKNACSDFRLHSLPNRERLLRETLAFGEMALHQGPHGARKHRVEGKTQKGCLLSSNWCRCASMSASDVTISPDSSRQSTNATSTPLSAFRWRSPLCTVRAISSRRRSRCSDVLGPREGGKHSIEAVGDQTWSPSKRRAIATARWAYSIACSCTPEAPSARAKIAKDFCREAIVSARALQRTLEQPEPLQVQGGRSNMSYVRAPALRGPSPRLIRAIWQHRQPLRRVWWDSRNLPARRCALPVALKR